MEKCIDLVELMVELVVSEKIDHHSMMQQNAVALLIVKQTCTHQQLVV